ncbi:hypothetical protein [Nostoc sp. 106C]|nr:hypothetical protein [Nostoc sp. 106C]
MKVDLGFLLSTQHFHVRGQKDKDVHALVVWLLHGYEPQRN